MSAAISLPILVSTNENSIKLAGPRYTPGLDPNAPNLEISGLVGAIDALAHSSKLVARGDSFAGDLASRWAKAPKHIQRLFAQTSLTPALLGELLSELVHQQPGSSMALANRVRRTLPKIERRFQNHLNELYRIRTAPVPSRQHGDLLSGQIREVQEFQDAIEDVGRFIRSPEFELVQRNLLLVRGGWGAGKTHMLCDIAKRYSADGLPVLLLLAQSLKRGVNPLVAAAEAVGSIGDEELLEGLDGLGRGAACRALLIIDGINEGDRNAWHSYIDRIAMKVKRYPNVALVLSCRTPFDTQLVAGKASSLFVGVIHNGFLDIEFDAQKEFFTYYDIPIPHIPLLAPEFSKPLFLKILCETLASLSKPTRKRRINEFAAGHKGMTKLLEDFVRQIGGPIEKDFNFSPLTCWKILKGDPVHSVGLAPLMAERAVDYVFRADCEQIIETVTGITDCTVQGDLIARLVNDGLLAEDGIVEDGWKEIVRLPYQRFSDHLISRHLLDKYLDKSSEAAVRRSFYANRPLGKIFALNDWGYDFKMPNLISALMLEFPERVKRLQPKCNRELLSYLPRNKRIKSLIQPFIEGLLWRDTVSFGEQTERLIAVLLKDSDEREGILEALVCLASRNGHPYNAANLYHRLGQMDLPTRDLFWSEFLRSCEREASIYRVMDWVERGDCERLSSAVVDNLIRLCSLFLTTTARPLRDRTTKSLVLLGDHHPDVLMKQTRESFQFNDPYVQERMLAAAYGSMMRKWAFPPPKLAEACLELATDLSRRLNGSDREPPIEHILMREYAEGIIALAERLHPHHPDLQSSVRTKISRRSIIPRVDRIPEAVVEAAKPAIHMDFGNYTIGRLIPKRGNYDYDNADYKVVLKKISWRILNLGFNGERFKSADSSISSNNFHFGRSDNGQKIDRYGKKYSWIAYYEVAGRRHLTGKIRDNYDARISDTDIDPSFPEPARVWKPTLKPTMFVSKYTDVAEWMAGGPTPDYKHLLKLEEIDGLKGPWVLIHGYISEQAPYDQREVFTFLRGLLVSPDQIGRLEELTRQVEYPGNSAIPDLREQHYLYAGEIGWSRKYGVHGRDRGGLALPSIGRAFDLHEYYTVRKRYADVGLWHHFRLMGLLSDKGLDAKAASVPNDDDFVEVQESKLIPGVEVEIPAWRFAWESYHSEENKGGNPEYPASALVEFLRLRKRGGAVDLVDGRGRVAMACREYGKDSSGLRSDLLYLRADLLERYLHHSGRALAWINWGERSMHYEVLEHVRENPNMQRVWDAHAHIHKRFLHY